MIKAPQEHCGGRIKCTGIGCGVGEGDPKIVLIGNMKGIDVRRKDLVW